MKRQNILLSATFNERVEKLTQDFLEFPIKIEASKSTVTPEKVKQLVYEIPNQRTKIEFLKELLSEAEKMQKKLGFKKRSAFFRYAVDMLTTAKQAKTVKPKAPEIPQIDFM